MAPGRKGGSRSGSRNASRRGGRARDKYAADDDDDVESETTASNLPSYSFGGRFLLDPRSEGWVPFEGKGMSCKFQGLPEAPAAVPSIREQQEAPASDLSCAN